MSTQAFAVLTDGNGGLRVAGVAFSEASAIDRAVSLIRAAVAAKRAKAAGQLGVYLTGLDRMHIEGIEAALASPSPSVAIDLWATYSELGVDEPIWIEEATFLDSLPPACVMVRGGVVESIDEIGELNPVHVRDYDASGFAVFATAKEADIDLHTDDIDEVSDDVLNDLGYGRDEIGIYSISKHGGRQ